MIFLNELQIYNFEFQLQGVKKPVKELTGLLDMMLRRFKPFPFFLGKPHETQLPVAFFDTRCILH